MRMDERNIKRRSQAHGRRRPGFVTGEPFVKLGSLSTKPARSATTSTMRHRGGDASSFIRAYGGNNIRAALKIAMPQTKIVTRETSMQNIRHAKRGK